MSASPLPQFGVYFDTGTSTPYGRQLGLNWSASPQLLIFGLRDASTSGLTLDFINPSRTYPKIWTIVSPGDPGCVSAYATGYVYTYPTSGTATTRTSQLYSWLNVTGC